MRLTHFLSYLYRTPVKESRNRKNALLFGIELSYHDFFYGHTATSIDIEKWFPYSSTPSRLSLRLCLPLSTQSLFRKPSACICPRHRRIAAFLRCHASYVLTRPVLLLPYLWRYGFIISSYTIFSKTLHSISRVSSCRIRNSSYQFTKSDISVFHNLEASGMSYILSIPYRNASFLMYSSLCFAPLLCLPVPSSSAQSKPLSTCMKCCIS